MFGKTGTYQQDLMVVADRLRQFLEVYVHHEIHL
jgi:hypothetical protein